MATRKITPAKTPKAAVPAKPPAAKRPVRAPAARAIAKPVKAAPAAKKAAAPARPLPEPKPKLVRDSFTMPKAEYAVIEQLKRRASVLERPAKKSELLRAGIKMLSTLTDEALLAALQAVPTIKTGRPKH
ncbi:MAG: hypothetical protein Q8R33_05190 [Burkholderiales bacterium]|nr:hypothetical protein [Burkholderiales bacterium]